MKIVATDRAPAAIGPYSQAVVVERMVYTAGQIALEPKTMALVGDDVGTQTERVFANLRAVLEAAGSGLDRVVKTTVYLAQMSDFAAMNDVYARQFGTNKPARSTVEVGALPKGALVEIDAVALQR